MTDRKNILLVEDNPDDEELTLRALKHGHPRSEIFVVRDGEEALEYLFGMGRYAGRKPYNLPQVVLLDLKLPKVGGLDVLRQVRAHPLTQHLPIVVLTSSSEEEDILNSYELGANSYVRKPVEFQRFVESIKQVGMYWSLINQTPPVPVIHPASKK
jgi:two-component system response regulator